mmetsp:Transcript_18001/g.36555  ORF Transcript_18001/g.36555 Transcript_18001/m.36555 type:complete len:282 (-) Transcript_18001:1266-2111(-)
MIGNLRPTHMAPQGFDISHKRQRHNPGKVGHGQIPLKPPNSSERLPKVVHLLPHLRQIRVHLGRHIGRLVLQRLHVVCHGRLTRQRWVHPELFQRGRLLGPLHALEIHDRLKIQGGSALPLGLKDIDEEFPGRSNQLEEGLDLGELTGDHLGVHGRGDGGTSRGGGGMVARWGGGRLLLLLHYWKLQDQRLEVVHVQQQLLRPRFADALQPQQGTMERGSEGRCELVAEAAEVGVGYEAADCDNKRLNGSVHRPDVGRLLPHGVQVAPVGGGHLAEGRLGP